MQTRKLADLEVGSVGLGTMGMSAFYTGAGTDDETAMDARAFRLGNALLARGLVPGDRVGVALPNSIECIIAYYALAKSGFELAQAAAKSGARARPSRSRRRSRC